MEAEKKRTGRQIGHNQSERHTHTTTPSERGEKGSREGRGRGRQEMNERQSDRHAPNGQRETGKQMSR